MTSTDIDCNFTNSLIPQYITILASQYTTILASLIQYYNITISFPREVVDVPSTCSRLDVALSNLVYCGVSLLMAQTVL